MSILGTFQFGPGMVLDSIEKHNRLTFNVTLFYFIFGICLFGGFMVICNVIHDNYIGRPKERVKQVWKEGVRTRKS